MKLSTWISKIFFLLMLTVLVLCTSGQNGKQYSSDGFNTDGNFTDSFRAYIDWNQLNFTANFC